MNVHLRDLEKASKAAPDASRGCLSGAPSGDGAVGRASAASVDPYRRMTLDDLAVGELYVLLSDLQVRAMDLPQSRLVGEVPEGAIVRLVEAIFHKDTLRLRIRHDPLGAQGDNSYIVVGWISAQTTFGKPLIRRATYGLAPLNPLKVRQLRYLASPYSGSTSRKRACSWSTVDSESTVSDSTEGSQVHDSSSEDGDTLVRRLTTGTRDCLAKLLTEIITVCASPLPTDVHKIERRVEHLKALLREVEATGQATAPEYRQGLAKINEWEQYINDSLRVARENLKAAMVQTADIHKESGVESLVACKELLTNVVKAAREAGMHEAELKDANLRRRRVHNWLEDTKGNLRVYCRMRPMTAKEHMSGEIDILTNHDHLSMTVAMTKSMAEKQGKAWQNHYKERRGVYEFDGVFCPGAQEELFEECKDLVRSAVDGYNVTIFAYGQTGAGKSYTLLGTRAEPGVAFRTIDELYAQIEAEQEQYTHSLRVAIGELYRNEFIDHLPESSKDHGDNPKKVHKTHLHANVIDEIFTQRPCGGQHEMHFMLREASGKRTVKATLMNEQSSRSHLLFTIFLERTNKETQDRTESKLTIADLAGSERLKKSGVTADAAKEAIEINRSLTALGDVFCALAAAQSHIPYNNHKLTQILKDALGGTAKTLVFVNVAPASGSFEETRNTLLYSQRAKKVINNGHGKAGGQSDGGGHGGGQSVRSLRSQQPVSRARSHSPNPEGKRTPPPQVGRRRANSNPRDSVGTTPTAPLTPKLLAKVSAR